MSRVGQTNLLEHVEVLTDRYMVLAEQFDNQNVLAQVREIIPDEVKDPTVSIQDVIKW